MIVKKGYLKCGVNKYDVQWQRCEIQRCHFLFYKETSMILLSCLGASNNKGITLIYIILFLMRAISSF